MKPVTFEYHRAQSVAEAAALLDRLEEAKILAGGQSLIPLMNYRLAAPAHLVDISRIDELGDIEVTADSVRVGATVTHSQLHAHDGAAEAIPLLREAEGLIAHEVIRNRGTVCGSLAHADPSGELTAVICLLGGSVRAASVDGERTIPASELFEGPLHSSLTETEVLIEAVFPRPGPATTTAMREVTRRHGDYAVCGVATAVEREGDGPVSSARAAFLSVAPTPLIIDLTDTLGGRQPAEIDQGALYDFVTAAVDPSTDIHATADYRRHLAGVLACQAVEASL
ncbi:MAG: xanthine dehydrogenase family protein subunit M [Actinomycetia bacterium]|nr:xanthine dehydrogenase family protein subunit M [Actinomycetes bacterium]